MIGGTCYHASDLAKNFYSKFTKGKLYLTNDKTAEMVKLVENSSRDIQIALANSIDMMCSKAGISSNEVIEFANKHPRVNILKPSCGVGGHCIAVDPWFLIEGFRAESKLLRQARDINDKKPYIVLDSVFSRIKLLKKQGVTNPRISVLGLTFKPDVDDLRESPALKIALELNKVSDLAVCEPNIKESQLKSIGFDNIMTMPESVEWADIVLILVAHSEFMAIKKLDLKDKDIIDSCGLLYAIDKAKFNIFVQGAKKLECEI